MSVSSDSTITERPIENRAAGGAQGGGSTQPAGVAAPRITPTDGELLTLFTRQDDREALDRLIDRHAAMVWRVCRTSLRRPQDAEDAFQATFLLLVRQARSIKASESAAGWLYRVAYRTSIRARKKLASRREESLAVDPHAPGEAAFPDLLQRQTTGVLVEELMRLPAKYQTPLVMRYLEGQSRRAIADQTDTTIAAVQGQLARGKQMLRHRLQRRGVSLAGAMAALGLGARGAKAAETAPAHLVGSTTSHSVALAGGGSLSASAAIVSLYQEGARAMLIAWLGKPAASIAAAAAVALMLLPPAPAGEDTVQPPGLRLAIAFDELEEQSTPASLLLAQADPPESRRRQSPEEPADKAPTTGVAGSPSAATAPTVQLEVKAYTEQAIREALLNQLSFIPGVRVEVDATVDSVSKKTKEAEASIVVPLSYAEGVFEHRQTNPEGDLQATVDKIKRTVEEIARPLLPKLSVGQDEYKQVSVEFVHDFTGGPNQQATAPTETAKPIELAKLLESLEERLTAAASWTKDKRVEGELEGLYQEVQKLRREQLQAAATNTAREIRAELTEIRAELKRPDSDSTASRRRQSLEEPATAPPTGVGGSPAVQRATEGSTPLRPQPTARIRYSYPISSTQSGGVSQSIYEPSDLNPHGWVAMAHGAPGIKLSVVLPGGATPNPKLKLLANSTDDWAQLRIEHEGDRRHLEEIALKRDEPRLETFAGQRVQLWYRSIPAENSATSPRLLLIARGYPAATQDDDSINKLPPPSAEAAMQWLYHSRKQPPKQEVATRPSGRLDYTDGKADGKKSLGGSGHLIRFELPDGAIGVKNLRIHGSRYGTKAAPREDFEISFLSEDRTEILAVEHAAYGLFRRGEEKWTTIRFDKPVVDLPKTFWVAIDFAPGRTKGIYLSYDTSTGGERSMTGLAQQEPEKHQPVTFGGDWMVQLILERGEAKATEPADLASRPRQWSESLSRSAARPGWQVPPTTGVVGSPSNSEAQYGPDSKMKQGQWRVFHEPSELNANGWAVVAELRAGEHAPILLRGDKRPRPHVRLLREVAETYSVTVAYLEIVDANPGDDLIRVPLSTVLVGKPATFRLRNRTDLVEIAYLQQSAGEKPAVVLIRHHKPDQQIGLPTLEVAQKLLNSGKPEPTGGSNSLAAGGSAPQPPVETKEKPYPGAWQELAARWEKDPNGPQLAAVDAAFLAEFCRDLWASEKVPGMSFVGSGEEAFKRLKAELSDDVPRYQRIREKFLAVEAKKKRPRLQPPVETANASPQLQTVAKPTDQSDISQAGIPLTARDADGDKRPSIAYGGRNATYGYSVGQLQERLNDVLDPSPGLSVDGDYGPLTEAAVKRFQKQASLPESGFADELTRDALGFVEPGDTTASRRRQSSEEAATRAGSQAPDETPTTGVDGSPPAELLAQLRDTATYQAAPPEVQQEFERRLAKKSAEAVRRRLEGTARRFVVGRVVVEEGDDPELVRAQMEILPGGFFFDLLGDTARPIAFRRHGYDPVERSCIDDEGPITDLGKVSMTRTPDAEQQTLTARVTLEGDGDPESIKVLLRTRNGPINTPSNGYEPRPRWSSGVPAEANEKGELRVRGLSPIGYDVDIQAEGFVSQTKRVDLSQPGASELGEIKLERPKTVELEYVVYRYDDDDDAHVRFDQADLGELLNPQRATLKPGEKFVSDPEQMPRGTSDFRIEQKDGKLTFRSSYGPFYSTDEGEKSFAGYAGVSRVQLTERDNPEIVDNHVYLLRSGYFDHYLLVRARVLKPDGEKMSEVDRQIERYNQQLDAAEKMLDESDKLRDQAEKTKSKAVYQALVKVATRKARASLEICLTVQGVGVEGLIAKATEAATTEGVIDAVELERELRPLTELTERLEGLSERNWFLDSMRPNRSEAQTVPK